MGCRRITRQIPNKRSGSDSHFILPTTNIIALYPHSSGFCHNMLFLWDSFQSWFHPGKYLRQMRGCSMSHKWWFTSKGLTLSPLHPSIDFASKELYCDFYGLFFFSYPIPYPTLIPFTALREFERILILIYLIWTHKNNKQSCQNNSIWPMRSFSYSYQQ